MSQKEIIIHIGLHKTGTSSIQRTLYNSRKLLKLNGFWYFGINENHSIPIYNWLSEIPECYHVNIKLNKSLKSIEEENKNLFKELLCEIKKSQSYKKILISGEDISILDIDHLYKLQSFLKKKFPFHSQKIIGFVRNPYKQASSLEQQKIKGGACNYIFPSDFYKKRLEKFLKVFGKDYVKIYDFEKACKDLNGPVGYFLKIIDAQSLRKEIKYEKVNESLSFYAVEILRYINQLSPLIINGSINNKRYFKDTVYIQEIAGPRFSISKDQKKKNKD